MRRFSQFALLASTVCFGSQAEATKYQFTGAISAETWNFDDTTGQGLGLVRAGDVIKGTFDYSPAPPSTQMTDQAIFGDAILNSKLEVYRGSTLVVTLTQAPTYFSNGNLVDQSQIFVRDGDPRGLRDTINLQAGGVGGLDPADQTKVVTAISLSPSHPDIVLPGWVIQFREACSSGTVAGGNCVSNDPAHDYYDGSQTALDLVHAFQHNSVADLYLTFQYAGGQFGFDGDFEQALGTVTSLAAVPEPATWTVMILGFGLMGSALRRHRLGKITFA